jgi:hypothetical protein
MKWKSGSSPKKGNRINYLDSKRYLVRFHDDLYAIKKWLGNRWDKHPSKGNPITHYFLIDDLSSSQKEKREK